MSFIGSEATRKPHEVVVLGLSPGLRFSFLCDQIG